MTNRSISSKNLPLRLLLLLLRDSKTAHIKLFLRGVRDGIARSCNNLPLRLLLLLLRDSKSAHIKLFLRGVRDGFARSSKHLPLRLLPAESLAYFRRQASTLGGTFVASPGVLLASVIYKF